MAYLAEITKPSLQDKESLEKLVYTNKQCTIDFTNQLVTKPWGEEYLLFENEFCAIWILHIEHKHNTSMHTHLQKETSLLSLDSNIVCKTLTESYALKSFESIFFAKGVFHQTHSTTLNGSYVLEVETPVNKFDLLRVDDSYGREGREYEDRSNYTNQEKLTLRLQDFQDTNINDISLHLIEISALKELKSYAKNTLAIVLSNTSLCGKIVSLETLYKKEIESQILILLLLQNESI